MRKIKNFYLNCLSLEKLKVKMLLMQLLGMTSIFVFSFVVK